MSIVNLNVYGKLNAFSQSKCPWSIQMLMVTPNADGQSTHDVFVTIVFFCRSFLLPTKQQWSVCFNSCSHTWLQNCRSFLLPLLAALQRITATC